MKMKNWISAVAVAASTIGGAAHAVPVALELALLVDVSGSVDANEYALQRDGYVKAFNDATIQAQIAALTGGIAVTYIEWSGQTEQVTRVGWTHITNATTAGNFATAVSGLLYSNAFGGLTAPGSAINFARPLFGTETGGSDNGFDSLRQVIDVSGDGRQNDPLNDGANTATARDAALAAGIDTINGLAILGENGLEAWYNANIKGGTGSFVIAAASFDDFDNAVKTKIGREVTVPEPATLALVGLALAGIGAMRRRHG
jgi:hypothetical protein